jgi:hypothetical protein
MSWEKERVCDVLSSMSVCRLSLRRGGHLPFIDQGEGDLQACRTVQLHVEVWRTTPGSWRPSWQPLLRSCRCGAFRT